MICQLCYLLKKNEIRFVYHLMNKSLQYRDILEEELYDNQYSVTDI